jgi:serine phosphatase RsbU (regulator of sigma subunit)
MCPTPSRGIMHSVDWLEKHEWATRRKLEEKETILHSGEAALLYSDGLVEAHDPAGEMFGFPRLRALIAEHGEKLSLADLLLEELHSFAGERWEQENDITILTLRRSATPS